MMAGNHVIVDMAVQQNPGKKEATGAEFMMCCSLLINMSSSAVQVGALPQFMD